MGFVVFLCVNVAKEKTTMKLVWVICDKKAKYCEPKGCIHSQMHHRISTCKSECCAGAAKCINIKELRKRGNYESIKR